MCLLLAALLYVLSERYLHHLHPSTVKPQLVVLSSGLGHIAVQYDSPRVHNNLTYTSDTGPFPPVSCIIIIIFCPLLPPLHLARLFTIASVLQLFLMIGVVETG